MDIKNLIREYLLLDSKTQRWTCQQEDEKNNIVEISETEATTEYYYVGKKEPLATSFKTTTTTVGDKEETFTESDGDSALKKVEFELLCQHFAEISETEAPTEFYYVGKKEPLATSFKTTTTTVGDKEETFTESDRDLALKKVEFELVCQHFTEKVKKTSMFDKEAIADLGKEKEKLLSYKDNLKKFSYKNFMKEKEMVDLIKSYGKKVAKMKQREENPTKFQEVLNQISDVVEIVKESLAPIKEDFQSLKEILGNVKNKVKTAVVTPVVSAFHKWQEAFKNKSELTKEFRC